MRSLAKSKGFAAVAMVSLAFALALNTTSFVVLDAFMHPFVAYREPERLVMLQEQGDPREERITWEERRAAVRAILARYSDSVTYHRMTRGILQTAFNADVRFFLDVAPNFFHVLDITPELGRRFVADDDHVIIVSRSFWLRELGGRKSLDGSLVTIEREAYSVVGVMPPGTDAPFGTEVWRVVPAATFIARIGSATVRLRDGTQREALSADLNSYANQLAQRFGVVRMPFRYSARTLAPDPYELSRFHLAMAGAAALILLIACANLANLMLARGSDRRRELALRLAIGASRAALVRQLVVEGALLAVAGGALGISTATWGIEIAQRALPRVPFLPLSTVLNVSWRVYAFGFVVTAFTVVLFGLLPALKASSVDVSEPLKEAGGTLTARGRRYSLLATTQVALALVLLMSGAVLARSARNLAGAVSEDLTKGLAQVMLNLPAGTTAPNGIQERFDNIVERVAAVPGVLAASIMTTARTIGNVAIPDDQQDSTARITLLAYRRVSPGYARTVGVEIIEGRDFREGDAETGGAAVVNEVAAHALWPNRSPIGHSIKLGTPASNAPWYRIVGVMRNSRSLASVRDPHLPQPPQVLVTASDTSRRREVILRTVPTDPAVLGHAAREIQAAAALPGPPFIWSPGRNTQDELEAQGFATGIFVFLGATGLGLAAVGLYGVLAYAVSRRAREFGVRIAIGATTESLFVLVLHDGAVMLLAGTAIGAFAAMTSTRLLDSFLYGVHHADVWALLLSEAVLCMVALVACLVPARRAMQANPVEILRAS